MRRKELSHHLARPGQVGGFTHDRSLTIGRVPSWQPRLEVLEDRTVPSVTAFGDFNGDGFMDLAVGLPLQDVNGQTDAGAVRVYYGAATGYGNSELWTQDSVGIADTAEQGDQFGFTLAVGDFNRDGRDDLAVGVPFEDLFRSDGMRTPDTGAVNIIYGSGGGLTATGSAFFHQDSPKIPHRNAGGDEFGYALAAGDFNGDTFADLVVGLPGNRAGPGNPADAGTIIAIYGKAGGLSGDGSNDLTQAYGGFGDTPELGDRFGASLAAGDFNGDGRTDVAVGVPGEDRDGSNDAGIVHVVYGTSTGLRGSGTQTWYQDSAGILDSAEAGDQFGLALAAGDFNGDGRADLAIGVPQEDSGSVSDAGVVHVLYGSSAKLTATNNQLWAQGSNGVGDSAEAGDQFGLALGAGDFNGDGRADLVVGVPLEDLGTIADAGALHVLYGSATGVSAAGTQFWSQDSPDVDDQAEAGDRFGNFLASADVNEDGSADLAVGVPRENGGSNPGAVNLLFGSGAGLTAAGDVFLANNTGGGAPSGAAALVAAESVWRYLDNGSDQGAAWRAPAFDDSDWKSGAAPLGYGDRDEATVVSFGPNSRSKYITTYFRRQFSVADPGAFTSLQLSLIRDDGAVVYLNGVEVFRSNMPAGAIAYTTRAAATTDGSAESTWYSTVVSPALLQAGDNVLAVEVHQRGPLSSDISFDLMLTG